VERQEAVSRPKPVGRRPQRYIVVDLEATCWDRETEPGHREMEIIEIGAVCLPIEAQGPVREFSAFVRPTLCPTLSDFCTRLTSIRQEDVDGAESFAQAFPRFVAWIGEEPFLLVAWGSYDLNQFQRECKRNGMPLPTTFKRCLNLRKEFSRLQKSKPLSLKAALEHLGLPLIGAHHRGLDDARSTAQIALRILPDLSV
jgi:inhibitor of KinA sporulation pathway (predicted exonuclease)